MSRLQTFLLGMATGVIATLVAQEVAYRRRAGRELRLSSKIADQLHRLEARTATIAARA